MKTDRELLREFVEARSQGAFDALVKRHLDWVYSVALRQVGQDRHLAEDVCQEVFSSMARKAAQLVELDAVNAWLFKATRFASSDLVRAERRRKHREWEAMKMAWADRVEASGLNWIEAGELLDEAIEELREEDRNALCLRFFEESSFAEVGERLGVQENAARMRVNRALEKLQTVLERHGVKSTAAALGTVCAGHTLVSAPAGLAASVSGSVITSASIGLLGTSKGLLWGLAIVGALGVASAYYQFSENARLKEELAQVSQARANLESRLAEEESRDMSLNKQTQAEASVSLAVAPASGSPAEDKLDVMARLKRADEWKNEGRLDEALAEYFWLFDNGVIERRSFVGLRTSSVLRGIIEIGESNPTALSGLRERRDGAEAAILSAVSDAQAEALDVGAWARINRELGESKRSLSVFDALGEGRVKEGLTIYLRDELMEERRYQDAIRSSTYGMALHSFERMIQREVAESASPEAREDLVKSHRSFAIKRAASDLELLAGAGESLKAVEFARTVLAHDSSDETVDLLRAHLERAQALWVLDELVQEAVSD